MLELRHRADCTSGTPNSLRRSEQGLRGEDRPRQMLIAFIYQPGDVKLNTFTAHLVEAELTYELFKEQHIKKEGKTRQPHF